MKATPDKLTGPSEDFARRFFIDDYQPYPDPEHRLKTERKEVIYSISSVEDCWRSMLVEECRATLASSDSQPISCRWFEYLLKARDI